VPSKAALELRTLVELDRRMLNKTSQCAPVKKASGEVDGENPTLRLSR
jgi:hypothetical protein